ncbi:MAG: DUF2691 family protein [Coriobacteriia bacterium]|nr:DUF2691 family protein [Coriobacteriia bacterium]
MIDGEVAYMATDTVRGVSFKIPQATLNATSDLLWQVLKCIDVEKYCWYSIQDQNEAWANFLEGTYAFEEDCYDGKSFLQEITSEHYIIFLKLQAYFEDGGFSEVHTYEDFQSSDCQLLFLIYDCGFIDIYAKDETVIRAIYENAASNGYTEIRYITEGNDWRTGVGMGARHY